MTDLDPGTLDALTRMIAAGDQRRARRVNTALATLRPYERRILWEAAVMGYVRGYQSGLIDARMHGVTFIDRSNRPYAPDKDIVADVVAHCDTTSGLYPYLAAACSGHRRRITRKRMWAWETLSAEESKVEP